VYEYFSNSFYGKSSMQSALDGSWFAFGRLRPTPRFRALQAKTEAMA